MYICGTALVKGHQRVIQKLEEPGRQLGLARRGSQCIQWSRRLTVSHLLLEIGKAIFSPVKYQLNYCDGDYLTFEYVFEPPPSTM